MKRRKSAESSLELLLDTICNTFGGVLFVAILIVVMLRMTSKSRVDSGAARVSETEQALLEERQAELQDTLASLRRAVDRLGLATPLREIAQAESLDQLERKKARRRELFEQRLATLSSLAERQASINQTTQELDEINQRQERAEQKSQSLRQDLTRQIAASSQEVNYSRLHHTNKHEIQVELRYGRFYVWHRYGPDGNRLGLNTDEYVVLGESTTEIRTTPIPSAGTLVAETPEAITALRARLKGFAPNRDCIGIVVYPESYEQFAVVKKVLVQLGFEYRLIPAKDGDKFQDRGGAGGAVQ